MLLLHAKIGLIMSLQTYQLKNTSFRELPLNFFVSSLSQNPSAFSKNSSFIDLTVPGNRLFQQENGELILIPKTPAEVIGEKVLRPLIDGICSFTSQLISKLPDASSFSSSFLNFYHSSWKPNIHSFSEDKKKEKVAKISCLRDQALPSSKTLNQVTPHPIASKSKDLSHFESSKMSVTKALFALDRVFTRFIQLLPMASAESLTKNNELAFPITSKSPLPFGKTLELAINMIISMPTCVDAIPELSGAECLEFMADWGLINNCQEFVKQRSLVSLKLLNTINKYKSMEMEIEEKCLYALRAENFFNKERELFEKGQNSLFSQSGSEPKTIWIKREKYSEDYFPGPTHF
jgi:hypothetical protein